MKTTDNTQNKQLSELSDEELKEVTGGAKQKFERTKHVCTIIDYFSCPNGVTHDKYNCLVCK